MRDGRLGDLLGTIPGCAPSSSAGGAGVLVCVSYSLPWTGSPFPPLRSSMIQPKIALSAWVKLGVSSLSSTDHIDRETAVEQVGAPPSLADVQCLLQEHLGERRGATSGHYFDGATHVVVVNGFTQERIGEIGA